MTSEIEKGYFAKIFAKAIIWLLLAYSVGFAVWTIFFTETGNGDNVEHIHATWLIANGKVPYRDFFQHHNPLLWYIFAPFLSLIKNPINILNILDAVHAVSVIVGIGTFFAVYKACKIFFANKYASLLSLLVLCPPYYYIYCFNYNPDTFMAFFFVWGIFFLFTYWRDKKCKDLIFSFVCFWVAVMFTQKILTVLAPLGLISICVFYKERAPIRNILYALIVPILGTTLFVVYLYYEDALNLYWQSNFVFNVRMQEYYGNRKVDVLDYQVFYISVILALISIVTQWKKANTQYKSIAVLFVLELLQRCFYFSIAPYYMLPLMAFTVYLNSVLIEKSANKNMMLIYMLLAVSVYYAGISKTRYLLYRTTDRSFARYLNANVTPCDYVISGFLSNQSILSKDPHYYWSLLGHVDIAGDELKIYPKPDLNSLVLRYKPKLVSGGIYWNNYYLNRGESVYVQQILPEILEQYYLPTPFKDLYILKYEYHGKNCHYDTEQRDWVYDRK